ncbi:MAG: DivIVA domain-containing protein [Candidatus Manganitrophus sp.]|nr:MAG: DivIVA domain-containing protein [Candidatus Manganitrophus sp.]
MDTDRYPPNDLLLRFPGYAPGEVDAFLENLASEIEEILKENADLRERIDDQGQTIAELKKTEGALTNTLLMAQKAIEEMKRTAQKEGDLIIRQAELRAEEITRSAMKEVSQVQGEILNLKRQRDFFVEKIRSLMQNLEKTMQWEDEKADQREEEASL